MYRKQPKTLENYERVLKIYCSTILAFCNFFSFIIESLYLNPKADETPELYFDIHLVSFSLMTFVS